MTQEENKKEIQSALTAQEKFDKFVSENGLSLTTKFVPLSISRNHSIVDLDTERDKLYSSHGLTLNWKVKLSSERSSMIQDYSKGIGHLDYPWVSTLGRKKMLLSEAKSINYYLYEAVENGRVYKSGYNLQSSPFEKPDLSQFPTPKLKEVLSSLCLDSEVANYGSFEDWAQDMGYDTDSRSAEKTYRDCQQVSSLFSKVLGGSHKLKELSDIMRELDNEPEPPKTKSIRPV